MNQSWGLNFRPQVQSWGSKTLPQVQEEDDEKSIPVKFTGQVRNVTFINE